MVVKDSRGWQYASLAEIQQWFAVRPLAAFDQRLKRKGCFAIWEHLKPITKVLMDVCPNMRIHLMGGRHHILDSLGA